MQSLNASAPSLEGYKKLEKVMKKSRQASMTKEMSILILNYNKLMEELKNNKSLIDVGDKGEDSGSDTDNSVDDIPIKELQKALPIKKFYRIRKKKRRNIASESPKKEEKPSSPTKLDQSVIIEPKQDKAFQSCAIRPKRIKAVQPLVRESSIKKRFFNLDLIPTEIEMVSKGIQTEENWSKVAHFLETPAEWDLRQSLKKNMLLNSKDWAQERSFRLRSHFPQVFFIKRWINKFVRWRSLDY